MIVSDAHGTTVTKTVTPEEGTAAEEKTEIKLPADLEKKFGAFMDKLKEVKRKSWAKRMDEQIKEWRR